MAARKKAAVTGKKKEKEKEEDDELILVCMKVLMMPRAPVPGSRRLPCVDCQQPVWLSPATEAGIGGKPHRTLCMECAAKLDDVEGVMPMTPGQEEEILAACPELTRAALRRKFPAKDEAKRKAATTDLLRRFRARKRIDN